MIATKHILPKSVKAIRSTCNVYLNWTSAAPRKPVFGLEGQCTSCRWFWLDVSAVSMIGRCLTRRAPPDLTGMPDTQMSLRDSLMSETPRPEGLHTWTSPSLIAGVAETGSSAWEVKEAILTKRTLCQPLQNNSGYSSASLRLDGFEVCGVMDSKGGNCGNHLYGYMHIRAKSYY